VDNGTEPGAADALAATGISHTLLQSETNLGGAGGYAYGVLTARALGADWVWLADDDGRPGSSWTLGRLLACAADHDLDVVSPLVVDQDDPNRLAFPLRRGLRWIRQREEIGHEVLVPNVANLFNGALFSAHALDAVGVPDPRLFVRGDEVEIHRRLRRSNLRFGTCAPATYLHPQGHDDWVPILGGRLTVLVPRDPVRRAGTFRNLGYLTAQPGLRWRRWPDEVRYLWYFVVQQRDITGWQAWRRASKAGRRELFASPARPVVTPQTGTRHTALV
jgi:rhamnopyranosyl-N-acetylglucosaminyl-diphospho-decaprenol beta-1,3/1,4-galactofuranosyltransferase